MNSKKNSFIIQLKYSPGVFKEFTLMGEKLRNHGYNSYYIVSKKYQWMFESISINNKYIKYFSESHNLKSMLKDSFRFIFINYKVIINIFKNIKPEFICFYGAHPINFLIIKIADKFYPKIKKGIFVHEPYKINKSKLGIFKKVYFFILEFLQGTSCRYANYVILPSPYAIQLFNIRYSWYNKEIHYSPLMIPHKNIVSKNRDYFSMVGNIFLDGRFQTFMEIIEFSVKNGFDYKFQIISSSPLCNNLRKTLFVKKKYHY